MLVIYTGKDIHFEISGCMGFIVLTSMQRKVEEEYNFSNISWGITSD